jgi:hypothetical protein
MKSAAVKKDRKLTELRIQEETVVREDTTKMGEETFPVIPGQELDVLVMYVSKQALDQLGQQVRTENRLSSLVNAYGISQNSEQVTILQEYAKIFSADFEKTKKLCEKVVKQHPLADRICQIRGISPYQLGLIMAHMRYPERFANPSKLMTYSGVGTKYGYHVSKKNINTINAIKHEQFVGNEEEFTRFGYPTTFQQRMFIIADSLMKQKGWFYDFYCNQKVRLIQRAKNEGSAELIGERWYMVGRKNQSIEAWANSNARWRMCRMLLEFVYEEWMKIRGLVPREPYVFEHLGHTSKITLDYVLAFERKQKEKGKIGEVED